jgi:hypothetical protein
MATLEQIAIKREQAIKRLQDLFRQLGVEYQEPETPKVYIYQLELNEIARLESIVRALEAYIATLPKTRKGEKAS